jgi:hypothetical protein
LTLTELLVDVVFVDDIFRFRAKLASKWLGVIDEIDKEGIGLHGGTPNLPRSCRTEARKTAPRPSLTKLFKLVSQG